MEAALASSGSGAQNGHTAVLQALLRAGANRKLKTQWEQTALSLFIDAKHEDVIKLLRAHGATQSPGP